MFNKRVKSGINGYFRPIAIRPPASKYFSVTVTSRRGAFAKFICASGRAYSLVSPEDVPRSPKLAVEENRVLPDRLAADFQLVGGEIGVGIADRQAAQDRQLLRDVQLRADDLRIPDDRDLGAAA
jgi:hypothetical protein